MTNIESEIQAYLDEHYVQKPKMNFRKYVLTRMQELLDKKRIVENGKRGKATWLYIDEFHVLLNSEYSAKYLQQLWKKVRKQGGLCTGITQNVVDLLQNYTASQIVNVTDEDTIYRLGSLICDVSCNVLRAYGRDCAAVSKERRIAYGSRDELQRSGRDTISGSSDAGREGELNEARKVWNTGDELSEGKREGEIHQSSQIRKISGEDAGSGRGSKSDDGASRETVSGDTQTGESKQYNGNVDDKTAGSDDGRGDSADGNHLQVSLDDNEELKKELDDIESLGVKKEAAEEYRQASFFDAEYGLTYPGKTAPAVTTDYMKKLSDDMEAAKSGKHNFLNPKKATIVPPEYVKQVLLRGSGFVNGRTRICKIFKTEIDAGTRAKLIKDEYGLGGAGWPIEGLGLHGYDTFKSQGIRFQWRDEDGEVEGYVSWREYRKGNRASYYVSRVSA